MNSKIAQIAFFYTLISIASLFLILWLVDYSQFGIPEFIPGIQLRTYGILILIAFILIFIFLQRHVLRSDPKRSVIALVVISIGVSLVSLLIYQSIRQLVLLRGQYSYDITSVFISSTIPNIIFMIAAASVAVELKKVQGIWRHVPTIALLLLVILSKQYIHRFEW
jgi:hypothetical protein